jgi:DNA (cytosine-5)-methyltransferase 1
MGCGHGQNCRAHIFCQSSRSSRENFYYGSVIDQLYLAIQGIVKNSNLAPRPGDIGFISAGSPCQGFSKLNFVNATQEKGLKNQSLVASVAAYVDFYRPKYGLLENVLAMAQKHKGRGEDVLSLNSSAPLLEWGINFQLSC